MGEDFPQAKLIDLLEIKEKIDSSRNLLWRKVMEAQAKKRWLGSWKQKLKSVHGSNSKMIKAKKRSSRHNGNSLEGSRRARRNTIETKVKTLKKLVPNGELSKGLDGLFSETAEYILSLQMRVRLMKTMVDALSGRSG